MVKRITILLLLSIVLQLSVYSQTAMKQMTVISLKVYIIDPTDISNPMQRSPFNNRTSLQAYYNSGTITFDEELTPCTLTIIDTDTGMMVFSDNIEKGTGSVDVPLESGRFIVKFEKEGYSYIGILVL